MTGTNTKVRSIFLTVLMVVSVFGGTVAFAGNAAAATNTDLDFGNENSNVSPGAEDLSVTHSADLQIGENQDVKQVRVDLGPADVSEVNANEFDIFVNNVEYTGSYTTFNTNDGVIEVTLDSVQEVADDDNVRVEIADVNAPVQSGTYSTQTRLRTSGGTTIDSWSDDYTVSSAGTDGDADPPYELNDADDAWDSGQARWTGQDLFLQDGSAGTYEIHRAIDTNDDGTPNAVGQFVKSVSLRENADHGNWTALVTTGGLSGDYVLTNTNGEPVTTDAAGNIGATTTDVASHHVEFRTQTFTAEFEDNTVASNSVATAQLSSNRAGYSVEISSDDFSDDEIADMLGEDDNVVSVSGTDLDADLNLDEEDPATGNYTFDFEVVDTGVSDSDFLEVTDAESTDATLNPNIVQEETGDVATFTIDLQNTDDVALVVGSEDVNYKTTVSLEDADDDGQVVVSMNTFLAGKVSNEADAWSTTDDEIVAVNRQITPNLEADERLEAADYELSAQISTEEQDVGTLVLGERSTDSATTWTAPGSANLNTYLDQVSQDDTVAQGDWAVVQVEASGFYGYLEDNSSLTSNNTGYLNYGGDNVQGMRLTVSSGDDPVNDQSGYLTLSDDAVNLDTDPANNTFYVLVDTTELDEDEYVAEFSINENNDYVEDEKFADNIESVNSSFTVEERTASFDTNNGNVTVESATNQTISGQTNIAPNTDISVQARATGDSAFLKSQTVTVQEDGSFSANLDFQNVSQDTQFTVTIPNQGFEDNAATPGIVAPAPTATVSISDQSSDGTTVTVDSASLSDGGFVTIHDGSLLDGDTFESVRGTSAYLESGSHSDITVSLDEPYEEDGTVIAMPHLDTNGNEAYDFVSSDGAEDGPYTDDQGNITLDSASLTISTPEPSPTPTDEPTPTPTDEPTPTPTDEPTPTPSPTDGGGPGFGLAAALIALAGAALLALRRD